MKYFKQVSISTRVFFITTLLFTLLVDGCSSSSSSTPATQATASLGTNVKNVQLTAGIPAEIKFSYTIPGDITNKGDFKINVSKTLASMTLSASPIATDTSRFETLKLLAYALIKDAFAAESAQIIAYISYTGDPNVCQSPHAFGPFTILGAIDTALTSDTSEVTPTQAAMDITNAGAFDVCVVTTPPIDAYITVPGVDVEIQDCASPAADIVGHWSGTYQCTNFGTVNEAGAVSLDITQNQDGSYHYIDDGAAEYDGHLCGNKFRFKGSLAGSYDESGTMIFSSGSAATKSSNWRSLFSSTQGGSCTDDLQKT